MAVVLLQSSWTIFWALGYKPIVRILVWRRIVSGQWSFPQLFCLKVWEGVISYLCLTKWPLKWKRRQNLANSRSEAQVGLVSEAAGRDGLGTLRRSGVSPSMNNKYILKISTQPSNLTRDYKTTHNWFWLSFFISINVSQIHYIHFLQNYLTHITVINFEASQTVCLVNEQNIHITTIHCTYLTVRKTIKLTYE